MNEFITSIKQFFCLHIKDYQGYLVYPTHTKRSKRKMFNIDYINICPKCGKILSGRKSYLKGLSRTKCAGIVHNLRNGGYVVIVRDEDKV